LQGNPKELDILFKELLIGVTNFFRDPAVWENLQNTVIPALIDKIPDGTTLRAWVPGCSTGEEAYTLAIAFKTVVEKCRPTSGINLQIFASDIDGDAIETARKGIFSMNIISSVPSKFLSRFFIKSEDHFRINTEIRETIVFAKHNVVIHPPFTKIDIITCRNLLIYMDSELQRKIIGLFYYSLLTDGILVLGSAETLGTQNHLFAPIDSKWKIFKRLISDLAPEMVSFPSAFCRTNPVEMETKIDAKSITNIQSQADQLLLQQFSPPGVLVNQKGDIIYISGRTGKYLEPAVGKANMNIFAMLREGLNHEFPTAFRKAISKKELVVMRNIKTGTNGGTQNIDVTIQLVEKPKTLKGMVMIVFTDSPSIAETASKPSKGKKVPDNSKQLELEEELILTRQELQNIHEEMQTTQEEQKSTNEELQSANEELQSTNEELTTSKEEMQSLNEELQTVNAELQAKVDDYMHVSNDMKNLLDSTDIATLFLDKELNIRRFTKQTTKLFKLINGDIGRPFTDLVSDLMYPDLVSDAVEVLRSLIFVEKHIPTKDNRWFSIRIMPYRTVDDRISGLVLTFMNISDIKHLEGELQENEQMHRLLLNASSDAIIRLTTDWNILEFNPMAEKMFTKKRDSVHMKNFVDLLVPEQEKAKTRIELNRLLAEGKQSKLQTQLVLKANQWMNIEWSVYVLFNNLKVPAGLLLTAKTDSEREIGN
jgi:two-component system CheB/CheR fusion protein